MFSFDLEKEKNTEIKGLMRSLNSKCDFDRQESLKKASRLSQLLFYFDKKKELEVLGQTFLKETEFKGNFNLWSWIENILVAYAEISDETRKSLIKEELLGAGIPDRVLDGTFLEGVFNEIEKYKKLAEEDTYYESAVAGFSLSAIIKLLKLKLCNKEVFDSLECDKKIEQCREDIASYLEKNPKGRLTT